jgi:hypothetical protein
VALNSLTLLFVTRLNSNTRATLLSYFAMFVTISPGLSNVRYQILLSSFTAYMYDLSLLINAIVASLCLSFDKSWTRILSIFLVPPI